MYLPLLLFFNSLYRFGLLSNDISFQPEGLPLVFLLEEVLEINSISFCSPGNILISPSFPKNRILDWQSFFFSFPALQKYHPIAFWPPWFLVSQLLILLWNSLSLLLLF